MISLEDCISTCGLTRKEVAAIAEQEHLTQISAGALAEHLLNFDGGSRKARNTIRDDIRAALAREDEAGAHQLILRLAQLVRTNA